MSMRGQRIPLQRALPSGLPDAGPAQAKNVRIPGGESHRLSQTTWNSATGFTYLAGCRTSLSAINGAMLTTRPVTCEHKGCTPREASC